MPNHISKRKFATFLEEYQFYLSESLQNNAEAQYELGYVACMQRSEIQKKCI